MHDINNMSMEECLGSKTDATYSMHSFDKERAIKGFVCLQWLDSRAVGPAERSGPGCYQPYPEVLFVYIIVLVCKLSDTEVI